MAYNTFLYHKLTILRQSTASFDCFAHNTQQIVPLLGEVAQIPNYIWVAAR